MSGNLSGSRPEKLKFENLHQNTPRLRPSVLVRNQP